MSFRYTVIIERAGDNWSAYVPDLPGCTTVGDSLDETRANMREAIEGHIRVLREFGEPVPAPSTVAAEVEVTAA